MFRRLLWCGAVAVAAVTVSSPAQAAPAAKGTVVCPGSFSLTGKYRSDEKGALRYYYARNASCAAARKLITSVARVDDDGYDGRGESTLVVLKVPGGSAWKCRGSSEISIRRKLARVNISCRPLTGRAGRRITVRSKNFYDEIARDLGETPGATQALSLRPLVNSHWAHR